MTRYVLAVLGSLSTLTPGFILWYKNRNKIRPYDLLSGLTNIDNQTRQEHLREYIGGVVNRNGKPYWTIVNIRVFYGQFLETWLLIKVQRGENYAYYLIDSTLARGDAITCFYSEEAIDVHDFFDDSGASDLRLVGQFHYDYIDAVGSDSGACSLSIVDRRQGDERYHLHVLVFGDGIEGALVLRTIHSAECYAAITLERS